MLNRIIFHVDMDAFFASIEIIRNPALKGKPVIVGGRPDQRGVVSTCSYEARAFGVRSAMSVSEAKRRCPDGIFLEGSYSLYREYSEKIIEIFHTLTEKVEVVSIDEAYMDVSDTADHYGGALPLAKLLQQVVFKQTQLTCSFGIATNKLVAKVASGKAKPNGIRQVLLGEEAKFLAPLSIEHLPGIGTKTKEIFNRAGIQLISDLQEMGIEALIEKYGPWGYQLYQSMMGNDSRPVEWGEYVPKSVGAETTFEADLSDCEALRNILKELAAKATRHLRENKMRTRSICLKLRDNTFKTITRSHMLFSDTQDVQTITQESVALFNRVYSGNPPLRLIGISLHKLTDSYWQPTLWDWERERNKESGARIQESGAASRASKFE
jgi:DNA polymerase-4